MNDHQYRVTLYSTPIPRPISFARHYWFVVESNERIERTEVWAPMWVDGKTTIVRNILPPQSGFRRSYFDSATNPRQTGVVRSEQTWSGGVGSLAAALSTVLATVEIHYPFAAYHRLWPGPNSNTFIAWMLSRAGVSYTLSWRAFGKNYPVII